MALAAIPIAYLAAALIGSLVPVNRGWEEPADGITVYIANNGIHSDIVMPANAQGLDWTPSCRRAISRTPIPMRNGSRSARARNASIWKRRAGGT